MTDEAKTKRQLMDELKELRQQFAQWQEVAAERRRAEEELYDEKERFRVLIEESPLGVALISRDGVYEYVNPTFKRIFGYTLADIPTGREWFRLAFPDPEYRRRVVSTWINDLKTVPRGETRPRTYNVVCQDGSEKTIHFRPVSLKGGHQILIFEDISQRRRALEDVTASEQRLRAILENLKMVAVILDRQGNVNFCNDFLLDLTHRTREEVLGRNWNELFLPPQFRERISSVFRETIRQGEFPAYYENPIVTSHGQERLIAWNNTALRDADGKVIAMASIGQDITERKQAEEALRKSEEKYRSILDNMEEGYYEVDLAGNMTFFNDSMNRMLGYTRGELQGMNFRELASPGAADGIFDRYHEVFETGAPARIIDYEVTTKGGEKVFLEGSASLMLDQAGEPVGFSGIFRDITERKKAAKDKERLEDQLRQAQKMQAIGTLAGGIAHDFNNILSAVMGFSELALVKAKAGESSLEYLEQVLQAGQRAKGLVQQILSFSRQTDSEPKPIQIAPIIQEALKLLRASLPTTIDIRVSVEPETGAVLADPTEIHQVMINLGTNAGHTMRDHGGVLAVTLQRVELDEDSAAEHVELSPGTYQRLTVSDTGRGMDKKTAERVFEPFFTTKEAGEGTGMGLSVVHGIVRGLKGAIAVDSEPGRGSTFNVYLPLMSTEADSHDALEKGLVPTGSERVLFVDDEKALVELGREILEFLGYRVTTTASSPKALEVFKARPDEFDVVITDMTMPQMTGLDLSSELRRIRADVPIILCTGFGSPELSDKAEAIGIRRVLIKPLMVRDMAEAIRQVLDENGQTSTP